MQVLYVASEAAPFAASGGLADVAGSLPRALCARGVDCRVVMPLYGSIPSAMREGMTFLADLSVPVSWRRQYCGVFETRVDGVIYYLLDNRFYFDREGMYGYYDDAERFSFFSRAVLEMLPRIGLRPDIIHVNDWQTALIPLFYSAFYGMHEGYENIKTVFTIHNIQYQGKYGTDLIDEVVGIPPAWRQAAEYDGCTNFMKAAIETAHRVTTVSPTYATEILDPWFSHGLDPMLRARQWKLQGILNGIDTERYDPARDGSIYVPYSVDTVTDGKRKNKRSLQERLCLPIRADVPMIGMVTRLVSHKGIDLVRYIADRLLSRDVQFVVLGSGEWEYEQFFRDLQGRYPDKFCYCHGFVPELAHKIYAAADVFLMPSQSEPCGLSQMVACRYGTVPVVREIGGLKDSIRDCGEEGGFGYTFKTYNADDMLGAIDRALDAYAHPRRFGNLRRRCMRQDFGWERSAAEYIRLYEDLLK